MKPTLNTETKNLHSVQIQIGENYLRMYFSYSTLIAIEGNGLNLFITPEHYSATTQKHKAHIRRQYSENTEILCSASEFAEMANNIGNPDWINTIFNR